MCQQARLQQPAPSLTPATACQLPPLRAAANLTAMAFSDSCTKIFSLRQDFNNVTVLQPGLGQCGAEGFVNQGQYQLNQTAPDGTTFIGWRCTDITFGVEGAVSTALFVQLSGNQSKSCVAEYNYTAPAPPPSPAPR